MMGHGIKMEVFFFFAFFPQDIAQEFLGPLSIVALRSHQNTSIKIHALFQDY